MILSEIFSPPCTEFNHYMKAKICFLWTVDPYTWFPVTLNGKTFLLVNYFTYATYSYDGYAFLTPLLIKTFLLKTENPQIFLLPSSQIFLLHRSENILTMDTWDIENYFYCRDCYLLFDQNVNIAFRVFLAYWFIICR